MKEVSLLIKGGSPRSATSLQFLRARSIAHILTASSDPMPAVDSRPSTVRHSSILHCDTSHVASRYCSYWQHPTGNADHLEEHESTSGKPLSLKCLTKQCKQFELLLSGHRCGKFEQA